MTAIDIRPFQGIRYDPAKVGDLGRVVAPPYDVISPQQQEALYETSPYNAVRLEYPRDAVAGARYQAAAAAFRSWRESGILRQDAKEAFYLARHRFQSGGKTHERCELMAAVHLESWTSGAILPHEHTAEGPKQDRLELMRACHANLSPIMALYADPRGAVARTLKATSSGAPAQSFQSIDGDGFDVWLIDDPTQVQAVREALRGPLYVADGHHRYETALRYKEEARTPAADYIMASLIALEDPGLLSLPYHRLLRTLPAQAHERLHQQINAYFVAEDIPIAGMAPEEAAALFESRIGSDGSPLMGLVERRTAEGSARPQGVGEDVMRLLRPISKEAVARSMPGRSTAWSALSPCLFAEVLLQPALDMRQQEAEAQGLLSYTRDTAAAIADVRSGRQDMAFLLDGVPLRAMTDVAQAGERLPHKSTYFHPKLATGLVLRSLEGTRASE